MSTEPESTKEQQAPKAGPQVQAAQEQTGDKESLDRLQEEAQDFFGEPSYVAAGAFAKLRQEGTTELSRDEAKSAIQAWKQAEVSE